jgi:NAD(P)-dependent dehydrogenase (short-subunit alcohol dehydrogenase family)
MASLALVTGASTGIGRACAERLAARGHHVLAGVRSEADAPPGTEALRLDVTDEGDVAAAAERVGGELQVLVNNAGIAVNGPVETLPVQEWRRQIEVNFLAQVAMTRALLPALLAARGTVVNMSSIGGRMALPLLGPYNASKFALEAFSDSLRREVAPLGVRVAVIEPGRIATPVWRKSLAEADALLGEMPEDARRRYDRTIRFLRREAERAADDGDPPSKVADAVEHAVTARRPRTRYVIGRDARIQAVMDRMLPDRGIDAALRYFMR